MTEQEGFDGIIDKLRTTAKECYEGREFLLAYESINGFPIDSYKAPVPFNLCKEQVIAGGFLVVAYMSLCSNEGPDARLNRFWQPFLDTRANQIVGLKLQVDQALQYLSRIIQNQPLFWSLAGKTGDRVRDKIQAVQTWGMVWIGKSFLPEGSFENTGRFGMQCLRQFFSFYTYFEEIMDAVYGAYTPPLPKKGFWETLFS